MHLSLSASLFLLKETVNWIAVFGIAYSLKICKASDECCKSRDASFVSP